MDALTPSAGSGYSMAVLWNLPITEAKDHGEIPLDGDALARSAWRQLTIADQWARLEGAQLHTIRTNQDDQDKVNPR